MSGLYKVLIVDDEMLIRKGIINYIDWEREGFQIAGEAANGKEAMQMIEKVEPDILITDIVMSDLDGTELVKLAKAKYPELEIIVLSSFENFDYVRSTFQNGVADYILKPKLNGEELIKTLRRIAPATKGTAKKAASMEEVLEKRIQGYTLPSHEEQMLKDFPYDRFFLTAICWLDSDMEGQVLESFMNLGVDKKALLLPENENDFYLLLINFPVEQQLSVKQELINLTNEHRGTGKNIASLISMPFSFIDELKNIHENSLQKLYNYLFYLSGESVLIDGELPETEKVNSFRLSQFIEVFKQKKFDNAIASLEKHVEQLTRDYTQDIFEFKSWLENIIFNVIVLLGNMKYNAEELEQAKYQYFADINEAKTAKSAVARFEEFLGAVQSLLADHTKADRSPGIQALLDYIDEHYADSLSLGALAEHFYYNPSYLSSYFSTHFHIGFSDYLNHVRIAKAKEILATSRSSVNQVSEMVGYGEPSYFCKVFKRIEGMSPGRYRKKSSAKM